MPLPSIRCTEIKSFFVNQNLLNLFQRTKRQPLKCDHFLGIAELQI